MCGHRVRTRHGQCQGECHSRFHIKKPIKMPSDEAMNHSQECIAFIAFTSSFHPFIVTKPSRGNTPFWGTPRGLRWACEFSGDTSRCLAGRKGGVRELDGLGSIFSTALQQEIGKNDCAKVSSSTGQYYLNRGERHL